MGYFSQEIIEFFFGKRGVKWGLSIAYAEASSGRVVPLHLQVGNNERST